MRTDGQRLEQHKGCARIESLPCIDSTAKSFERRYGGGNCRDTFDDS